MSTIVLAVKMQSGYTALIFFKKLVLLIFPGSDSCLHHRDFLVYALNEKDRG